MRRTLARLATAVSLLGGLVGFTAISVTPAAAATRTYTVTLTASATLVPSGTVVTLTASWSPPFRGADLPVAIIINHLDNTNGGFDVECYGPAPDQPLLSISSCSTTVQENNTAAHTYYAEGAYQASGVSNPVTVRWCCNTPQLVPSADCVTSVTPLTVTYSGHGKITQTIAPYFTFFFASGTLFGYTRYDRTDNCASDVGWHQNLYGDNGQAGQITQWAQYVCDGSDVFATKLNCRFIMEGQAFNDAQTHTIRDYDTYKDVAGPGLFHYPSRYYFRFVAYWLSDLTGLFLARVNTAGCWPYPCGSYDHETW